jgi:hypothetical protein
MILKLLSPSVYSGSDNVVSKSVPLYSVAELVDITLASKYEISCFLKNQKVAEIDGKVRLLSLTTLQATTRSLLDTIIEHSISLENVCFERCRSLIDTVDVVLLKNIFDSLGKPSADDSTKWDFNLDEVCRASASSIFEEAGVVVMDKQEFLDAWGLRTPCKGTPREELLSGIAVIDEIAVEPTKQPIRYRYLPLSRLSKDLTVSNCLHFGNELKVDVAGSYIRVVFCTATIQG